MLTKQQLLDYFIHHATMHDTGNTQRPFFVQCKIGNTTLMAEADTPWDAYNGLIDSVFPKNSTFPRIYLMRSLTKAYNQALKHTS